MNISGSVIRRVASARLEVHRDPQDRAAAESLGEFLFAFVSEMVQLRKHRWHDP